MDDWLIGACVAVGGEGSGEAECDAGPFTLKISWTEAEGDTVVEVRGELEHDLGDSFRSIVDLQLSIGERDKEWMVGNLWPSADMGFVWRKNRRGKKIVGEERLTIKYRASILSKTDLRMQSGLRDFRVLCAFKCWFVDINRLVGHGGLFAEWKRKMDEEAVTQMVSLEAPSDMECLLEALQAYDQPVVHRGNYRILLPLASRLRLHVLLRHIEDWLMQSHFHPIRLLELAAMHRMARLYDFGTKQLGAPSDALKMLHVYLSEHGCTLNDLPPALYPAFKITSRTIIL
ncbi:hypothetical protein PFISCL1PPCAC_23016 [Pristionchus fissidentatus]|uniref:Uncharacterized protein n=1 Tax=Pristionchus fissidentatus TaxID=1538716 RepID=A0AAV5WPN4_9BILA|nr:hypothetical protein PFISCL1PPCAC_23016 [Pristionchus fissidentatus]